MQGKFSRATSSVVSDSTVTIDFRCARDRFNPQLPQTLGDLPQMASATSRMVIPAGLEPAAYSLGNCRSIHLSYGTYRKGER